MLDLVGTLIGSVVSGFNQGRHERDLEDAMVELARTPRSLDQPVYRAYEFEQMTVRARKEATIPVALFDRASGQRLARRAAAERAARVRPSSTGSIRATGTTRNAARRA